MLAAIAAVALLIGVTWGAIAGYVGGRVDAVMFNLGYLPGADKSVITQSATTCAALDQAIRLLRTGGLVSIMVYPGHAGGVKEAEGVTAWLARLPPAYRVRSERSPGPVLHLVERTG